MIRYIIDRGCAVIPKSTTEDRIVANGDIFDFELSKNEIETILGFEKGFRIVELSHNIHHKENVEEKFKCQKIPKST